MRIVMFGAGGALSARAIEAVGARHEVAGVVTAAGRRESIQSRLRGMARDVVRSVIAADDEVSRAARALGAPTLPMRGKGDGAIAERIRRLEPELICIAGFPWLLGADVLGVPPAGVINVHPSLLPRHRGPMPLFWVYVHDDRETGVTTHWVNERADAGPVIARESFPVGRGESIVSLHERGIDFGVRLLAGAVDDVASGMRTGEPQDESKATTDPLVRRGDSFVDFAGWDVERVWHVLAGLHPMMHQPLTDSTGRALSYGAVMGFERRTHSKLPGSVTVDTGELLLHCRGGDVRLAPASR